MKEGENLQTACLNELEALFSQKPSTLFINLLNKSQLFQPLYSLLFGFLLGFFSSKPELILNEASLEDLLQIFNDITSKTKVFEDILKLLSIEMTSYLYKHVQVNPLVNNVSSETKEDKVIDNINDHIEPFKEEIINININEGELRDQVQGVEEKEKEEEAGEVYAQCTLCQKEFNFSSKLNYDLTCGCIIHDICFNNHIVAGVTSGNTTYDCPLCKKAIEPNSILKALNSTDSVLIEKYESLTLKGYMEQSDDVRACPTAGCNYLFYFDEEDTQFDCPTCEHSYCLKCHSDWHLHKTCKQYQLSLNQQFRDVHMPISFDGRTNFKRCPKCYLWNPVPLRGYYDRKTRQIQCRNCDTLYCLECGDKYEMNHGCNYARMPDRKIFNHDNHKQLVNKRKR